MAALFGFKNMDLYLLDQIFKGHLTKEHCILDAGCGSGRNLIPLAKNGFTISGIDPDKDRLSQIKYSLGTQAQINESTIENFSAKAQYDYIICNAVLHFAKSHDHFDSMLNKLVSLLNVNGQIFIRMTSNIGLENKLGHGNNGVYDLPDGTTRYLLSRQKVDIILKQHHLTLKEPVKTVFVDGLRSMTTLVLARYTSQRLKS